MKIEEVMQRMKPGTVTMIEYVHDEWCPKLKGIGECLCDPDVYLVHKNGRRERVCFPGEARERLDRSTRVKP
jgi:hypothetical protein